MGEGVNVRTTRAAGEPPAALTRVRPAPHGALGVDARGEECFDDAMRLSGSTLAVPLAVLALAACAGRRIPGTDIKDNADTRAVVAAIDAYRQAAERRDAGAVLALVSPKYFDDAGTPDPGDDVDYAQLKKRLTDDYQKVTAIRLEMGVKKIEVEGDRAAAYVFYDEHYRITTKAGEIAKQASDQHRMQLVRESGAWKFVSGL